MGVMDCEIGLYWREIVRMYLCIYVRLVVNVNVLSSGSRHCTRIYIVSTWRT